MRRALILPTVTILLLLGLCIANGLLLRQHTDRWSGMAAETARYARSERWPEARRELDALAADWDEATNGLDPVVRDEVTDLLLDFARDENHSILISSHIVSDLEKLCDTIAFLHKGRLLLCEEKDALREEYALWHGTAAQLAALDAQVYGKRVTPYGAEALVRRDALPAGAELTPVSIEELFVLMVKGEDVQ